MRTNAVIWKLYLLGRKNEYKLLGFIWAREDITPQGTVTTKHANLCADIVQQAKEK